jgi:serine/threonine protein kinase
MVGDSGYGFGVDIWAVGCVLGEMINGGQSLFKCVRDDLKEEFVSQLLQIEVWENDQTDGWWDEVKNDLANEKWCHSCNQESKAYVSKNSIHPRANDEICPHRHLISVLGEFIDHGKPGFVPLAQRLAGSGASEIEIDLLKKLLTFSPSKRIFAKNALQHPFFDKPQL